MTLADRVARRFLNAGRRKAPAVPIKKEPPNLDKIVDNAVENEILRVWDKVDLVKAIKDVRVSPKDRRSFSDGILPGRRDGSIGYSFTVKYPTAAMMTGEIEFEIDEDKIVRDVADDLSYEDTTFETPVIRAAITKVDFEKHIQSTIKHAGELPDDHYDLDDDLRDKVEEAAAEHLEESMEAYTEDDPHLDLGEYPSLYYRWKMKRKSVEYGKPQADGRKYKMTFKILWDIAPDRWAFEDGARSNQWHRLGL
jgi:hypothetical protein